MPQRNDLPRWVEETPYIDYMMTMFSDHGTHETVTLTRREYKWLKKRLARRRGYLSKPDPTAVPEDAASIFERGRKLVREANDVA